MDPDTLVQPMFDIIPTVISIMMVGMIFGMLGGMFRFGRK